MIFEQMYPLTRWGKIDWAKICPRVDLYGDPHRIIPTLKQLLNQTTIDTSIYIEWSDGGLPVIKADLQDVVDRFDDVTCVTFEKFIFNPYVGYIIEVVPGDGIMVGLVESLCKEVV